MTGAVSQTAGRKTTRSVGRCSANRFDRASATVRRWSSVVNASGQPSRVTNTCFMSVFLPFLFLLLPLFQRDGSRVKGRAHVRPAGLKSRLACSRNLRDRLSRPMVCFECLCCKRCGFQSIALIERGQLLTDRFGKNTPTRAELFAPALGCQLCRHAVSDHGFSSLSVCSSLTRARQCSSLQRAMRLTHHHPASRRVASRASTSEVGDASCSIYARTTAARICSARPTTCGVFPRSGGRPTARHCCWATRWRSSRKHDGQVLLARRDSVRFLCNGHSRTGNVTDQEGPQANRTCTMCPPSC